MSCPSSGQQGIYPQTPQQWPGQPCQPCWSCQPTQPNWPVNQPSTSVPATWPVQPTQPGWPNPPNTPTLQPNPPTQPTQPIQPFQPTQPFPPTQPTQPIQPNPPVQPNPPIQPNPPVQPSWPAQPPTPTGYLPSPAPPAWHGNPGQPGWPGQGPAGGAPQQWPPAPAIAPVTVPFNMNFPRGIYDKLMLTIRGQIKPDAKMFTINFLRGNDIALHINPRFSEGGKPVLVRNHKLGERWGKEERDLLSPFPFMPGHHFEMKILCTFTEFKVAVNNTPAFDFQHRIREVNQINRINILHDVTLTSVNVETLP
ncbi:galectin-3-like [Carassius auratus]|uniref:Galectin n=1 Tax=Carassius auratus TaxID=7957 RepID=A0A6P6MKB6_CARAU|nr:galectin-3-like [Carassius auratus]